MSLTVAGQVFEVQPVECAHTRQRRIYLPELEAVVDRNQCLHAEKNIRETYTLFQKEHKRRVGRFVQTAHTLITYTSTSVRV